MIGGTSGSETEALPAASSQSKSTHTRSASFGVTIDGRTLGAVLLSLLGTLGREDLQEAIEIFDRRRCENHLLLLRLGSGVTLPLLATIAQR